MFTHAQRFRHTPHLQHRAHAHAVLRIGGISAENADSAGTGLHESEQQFHGGGFTRAVRAKKSHEFAGMHGKVHTPERRHLVVVLAHPREASNVAGYSCARCAPYFFKGCDHFLLSRCNLSGKLFHPEMTSSWNPAERTSADYHADGLTIVIFGEEYWQFPCRSGRVKFLRREGNGRRGYENRIKSGELSLRFGVAFSALVT